MRPWTWPAPRWATSPQADAASLPAVTQARLLRELERAGSQHTAARARVLTAFTAQGGYADDGHGGPHPWLAWQTRVTAKAASGSIGWMRRLSAHPRIAGALAAGQISESYARKICGWTDLLPYAYRDTADEFLAGQAAGAWTWTACPGWPSRSAPMSPRRTGTRTMTPGSRTGSSG